MPTKDFGKLRPYLRGDYAAITAYEYFDAVKYGGTWWLCIALNGASDITPVEGTTWTAWGMKGNDAVGYFSITPAAGKVPQADANAKIDTGWLEMAAIRTIIAAGPTHYERDACPVVTKTTVVIQPMWINVNNIGFVQATALTLNLSQADAWDSTTTNYTVAAARAGKDFYIYACVSAGALVFKLSANSTVPSGFTAATSRKIGGFHCLCASVGTISGHTLSGYVAGDILPASIWDLKHRPVATPEGMVYISGLGLWVDIYLASWSGSKLNSVYGGVIADGASSEIFHGYKFDEKFGLIGKRSVWQREFQVFSDGSNQLTNISGSADPNTTGGHIDTSSRRTISNYGVEDCCGVLWQWSNGSAEYSPGLAWTSPNKYVGGYDWKDVVYESTIESSRGQSYGLPRRVLLGGAWDNGAHCGSRCSAWDNVPARLNSDIAGRGASEPSRGA